MGRGAVILLCGRLSLLHRAVGCWYHPAACLWMSRTNIIARYAFRRKGYFTDQQGRGSRRALFISKAPLCKGDWQCEAPTEGL